MLLKAFKEDTSFDKDTSPPRNIVATDAFGIGIDIHNIDTVVLYPMPDKETDKIESSSNLNTAFKRRPSLKSIPEHLLLLKYHT